MHYKQEGNQIIVTGIDSFDIGETLESGQCFRFTKLEENHYRLVAHSKVLNVLQEGDSFTFYPCAPDEFESLWAHYFDLNSDYGEIKRVLSANDPVMEEAIGYASGIRLLNQDVWECLVSFIISQNNHIARIKQIIENICVKYGEDIGGACAFPTPASLARTDIDELLLCRTGFRAKYILDAAAKIDRGEIDIFGFKNAATDDIRESLQNIHGVGTKVSDCVLLFACGRRDVFPIDVWVKRVMTKLYFGGEAVTNTKIREYAYERFSRYAGFAQQYLFHYGRTGGKQG